MASKRSYINKLLSMSITILLISMTLFTYILNSENKGAPLGGEFQVNTYTTSSQSEPSTAIDSSGNFVIAWQSWGQDVEEWGVYAKRFDSDGNEFTPPPGALKGGESGNEFRVNTYTTMSQSNPSVAMNSTGDFVIVWESGGQDADGWGIYAQRYDKNGNLLGAEFRVNSYQVDDQRYPAVAMNSNGDFVIVWMSLGQNGGFSYQIYAKRYNSSGSELTPPVGAKRGGESGNEFRVNNVTTNSHWNPCVALDSQGNFVIVYQPFGQDGDQRCIYAQLYNSTGYLVGEEFQVNSYTIDDQEDPSVAMDSFGNFVISWVSYGQNTSWDIFAKHYDSNGNELTPPQDAIKGGEVGNEFRVNTYLSSGQRFPSVTMEPSGNFVITWRSWNQDGDENGVYAQFYDSNGYPFDNEFQVNTYTTLSQTNPSASMDLMGNFVISWESEDQDGSSDGIYAQRFHVDTSCSISDIQVIDITDTTATMTWSTNLVANSSVDYGFSPARGSIVQNDTKVIFHSINLTGLEPGRLYHFRVASYLNSTNYDISENFTFTTKFRIELYQGWNLISLLLNQTDTNLGNVLENISGDYDAVQWYDINDPADPWKHNHTGKPQSMNDLSEIDRFKAIWIHIIDPLGTTLFVNGTAPEVDYINQVTLYSGWNHVGYPSLIEREPDSSGLPAEVDMIQWYNASSGLWESWDPGGSPDTLNILKPGQGLWVHYTGATDVWSLEYVN
jgi:hypothetical protein